VTALARKRGILVTGAVGQVGTDLVPVLRERHGAENVVATGHRTMPSQSFRASGPFEVLDATDATLLRSVFERHDVGTVYHLAALLSASSEAEPHRAWRVNLEGLKLVLDLAVEFAVDQVFWPSSIAVFGPSSPREMTPQQTVLEPSTMYGVTKLAGENLCAYCHRRFGLDVRSLRYPGLVSYKHFSGGGTTDYSVEMFFEARRHGRYTCFVRPETRLPLLYMDDAIRATVELMQADPSALTVRTSYNLAGCDFSAEQLANAIAARVPGFACEYVPDFRQAIADSWPMTVDDSVARRDWGWAPRFEIGELVDAMFAGIDQEATAAEKQQ
jgi:nucleoside-diphosphate-sugar epimerase